MSAPYIKVGEDLLQDAILESVKVTQELNQHWWCEIACRQTEDERVPVEKYLGMDLQLITYLDDDSEQIVFDGFVLDVELIYEITGSYTAKIMAVTKSYKLDVTEQHRYYLAKTLKDIATDLTGEDGLSAKIQCADKRALNYVQYGETDFDFLRRLADDHGCWMRPSATGIEILDSFQPGTDLEWRAEGGLLGFAAKATLGQPSFNGAHYDYHQMQSRVFTGVSDQPQFYDAIGPLVQALLDQSKAKIPAGFLQERSRAVSLDDYETVLKKESVRSLGGNIGARGTSLNSKLRPGDAVNVQGTLDAAGTYGVTKVLHQWNPAGYLNEFWCTPWKQYTSPDPPPAKKWLGLVPARVVDHNDPKKMGRIRVQFFWQEDGPGHWARLVTPHAGAGRGFTFMPETGDEVAVGFEDGDPERPVIFGCVWNGAASAPRSGFYDKAGDVTSNADLQSNNVKRLVTKGGNRLQMVDTPGKQSVVLGTPNSIRIQMIENTEESGRTMLCLDSSGDIFINAAGRIHFKSKYFSREIG
jgi:type VI secretion system secreted protein VgrG